MSLSASLTFAAVTTSKTQDCRASFRAERISSLSSTNSIFGLVLSPFRYRANPGFLAIGRLESRHRTPFWSQLGPTCKLNGIL
jgi:hypothetical protein